MELRAKVPIRLLPAWGFLLLLGAGEFSWPVQAQQFPPNPSPQVEISTAQRVVILSSIQQPGELSVNVTLRSGEIRSADLYIFLSVGVDGRESLAVNSAGQFAKWVLPFAGAVELKDSTHTFSLRIPSYLSPGPHALTAKLVRPQSDPAVEAKVLASGSTTFTVEHRSGPPLGVAEQGNEWLSKQTFPQPQLHAWDRIFILPYGVGNLFVDYRVPLWRTQKYPVVFVHGEAVTGAVYEMTKKDGEEGWATYFQRRGFPVFIVDWPGVGRSAFGGKENHEKRLTNEKIADDLVELLDRIGPSILVTKSWAGTVGWMAADRRPFLVRGIVALTPRVLGAKPSYRRPVSFGPGGSPTRFYPPNPEDIDPAGDPDFTKDVLTNAPELKPRDWINEIKPGWYDKEIGEGELYTYVDGPGRVPIPPAMRDELRVPLTPVGSPDRPGADVTFKRTKVLVLIGEADPTKSLEYGGRLAAALNKAGVQAAEFRPLSRETGFAGQGFDLEDGPNSGRIAALVWDWMLRVDLAKNAAGRE